MSDKAERVAKLIWDGVYGNGHVPPIVAAILREEYPDEPTLDQLAKAQGVEPIEDMGTLVIPGLEDDPPIDPAPDVSALREVSPGVWLTESRHAAECLWRDLPLNDDGTFRSTTSSLDTIEKHMVAFLEGHRPDLDVSEAEKELCMAILGERGRSVDEVNRLVTLLIAYREGLKAQAAPDVSALREKIESLDRYDIMSNSHDSWFVSRENGDYIKRADVLALRAEGGKP
jgi:hypothetical protein